MSSLRVGSQLPYQDIAGKAEADRVGKDDGPLDLQNAKGGPKGKADDRERVHSTRDRGCIAGPDDFPDLRHETGYRAEGREVAYQQRNIHEQSFFH